MNINPNSISLTVCQIRSTYLGKAFVVFINSSKVSSTRPPVFNSRYLNVF